MPSLSEHVHVPLLPSNNEGLEEKDLDELASSSPTPRLQLSTSKYFPYVSFAFNVLIFGFILLSHDDNVRRIPWRGAPQVYSESFPSRALWSTSLMSSPF